MIIILQYPQHCTAVPNKETDIIIPQQIYFYSWIGLEIIEWKIKQVSSYIQLLQACLLTCLMLLVRGSVMLY